MVNEDAVSGLFHKYNLHQGQAACTKCEPPMKGLVRRGGMFGLCQCGLDQFPDASTQKAFLKVLGGIIRGLDPQLTKEQRNKLAKFEVEQKQIANQRLVKDAAETALRQKHSEEVARKEAVNEGTTVPMSKSDPVITDLVEQLDGAHKAAAAKAAAEERARKMKEERNAGGTGASEG